MISAALRIMRRLVRADQADAVIVVRPRLSEPTAPQPNQIALSIDAALAARRRARVSRSEAATAGHATRRAQRLPDPVVSARRH